MELSIDVRFNKRRYTSPARAYAAYGIKLQQDWDGSVTEVKEELQEHLQRVANAVADRHNNAWPGGTTDGTLSRRSGKGVEAIRKSVEIKGSRLDTLTGMFRLEGPMVVHEYGATINAKNKLLTIPLPAALNKNGTPKKRSAKEWKNTFVARTRAGNLLIFQRRGRNIVPLYVLKTQVSVPARLGLREATQQSLPYFTERAADIIASELGK